MAGCRYMRLFIAGATATGQAAASAAVLSEVVGVAVRELGDRVRGGRRDQIQLGALDQRQVADRRALGQRLARIGAARRVGLELARSAPARR